MPDLPKKKVGIVACSGEELPEGTISRLAALQVLEELRPSETVTICLPLFLAGGEGDRAFARFYPTVAIDGCEQRCAARATERYSGKPVANVVVREVWTQARLDPPHGLRRLDEAGQQAVAATAQQVAALVDELLTSRWSRREGKLHQDEGPSDNLSTSEPEIAPCACGSGIPVQRITVQGRMVTLVALPLLFEQFWDAGKTAEPGMIPELLETVKIYNSIPSDEEGAYGQAILAEFQDYCARQDIS